MRHIQYKRTASRRAMATFAIFRPRRITRRKNWLRHLGLLRSVTWAASTSKKRSKPVTLFTDVPQLSSFAAGIFCRHQTEIAGNLLTAVKSVGFPDDQHESECG